MKYKQQYMATGYLVGMVLAAVCLLLFMATDVRGSDYKSNFDKIPSISDRPIRVATWKRTPTVIVCANAPVKEAPVKKAVKFWEDLGHHFFTTQYNHDPLNKCRQSDPVGYIIIRLITQEIKLGEDSLAVTHFYVDNDTRQVDWAIIYLKNDIRDTVLEHEIGHALGYLHFNKINHLMNSKWIQGGWDTVGLHQR